MLNNEIEKKHKLEKEKEKEKTLFKWIMLCDDL
jgi:hypothetical protein